MSLYLLTFQVATLQHSLLVSTMSLILLEILAGANDYIYLASFLMLPSLLSANSLYGSTIVITT